MASPGVTSPQSRRGSGTKIRGPSRPTSVVALELRRRDRHVRGLLANLELDPDQAAAWVLVFVDERDPLIVLPEWLEAGWRDPLVVQACLGAFGSMKASQLAFDLLDWELSPAWDASTPGALLEVVGRF